MPIHQVATPSGHGEIGDDSDGYVLVEAIDKQLKQCDYWQSQMQECGDYPGNMLDELIHRMALDGHLTRSAYIVHCCWG